MNVNKGNVGKCILEFQSRVNKIVNSGADIFSEDIHGVFDLFNDIAIFLSESRKLDESVYKFVINPLENKDIALPNEYLGLKDIFRLYDAIRLIAEKSLSEYVKKEDYKSAFDTLVKAIEYDVQNVELVHYVEQQFIEKDLYNEITDMYKLSFMHTSNPRAFEWIGDIKYKQKDYISASDSYLSCAELIGPDVQIYEKLADVFDKLKDNESKQACLEQIKVIKSGL